MMKPYLSWTGPIEVLHSKIKDIYKEKDNFSVKDSVEGFIDSF
jgi:hypothetical protein